MRNTSLVALVSSLLLGSAVAHADPATDTPSDRRPPPPATPATPSSDAQKPSAGNSANPNVGKSRNNVDKPATSGAYYPYSAGTAGADPAKPNTTSVSPAAAAGMPAAQPGPTDRWMEYDLDGNGSLSRVELTQAAPSLAPSFEKMDVNGDGKLTPDELRAWDQSHDARKDAKPPMKVSPPTKPVRDTPPAEPKQP